MKRALVTGAGGFIGHHLVRRLKAEGYWVRAVDIKLPEFSDSAADEFVISDLREPANCKDVLESRERFTEVYSLAADMGGMGFIHAAECEIIKNNTLINMHMIDQAVQAKVPKYFFASSACVYPDMDADDAFVSEDAAYPALPDNEYGWEKLYAERAALTYGRRYGIEVRIARFQNCYGPEGTWRGGREKAPAAICRKVAEIQDGGTIEVWGDGSALRSYTYVSDIVDGIYVLMQSGLAVPVNLGIEEFVTVNELVQTVGAVAKKRFSVRHIDGPIGVQARNHTFDLMRKATGWKASISLREGLARTYPWIAEQLRKSKMASGIYQSAFDAESRMF